MQPGQVEDPVDPRENVLVRHQLPLPGDAAAVVRVRSGPAEASRD
jgi:hypothetical protein